MNAGLQSRVERAAGRDFFTAADGLDLRVRSTKILMRPLRQDLLPFHQDRANQGIGMHTPAAFFGLF